MSTRKILIKGGTYTSIAQIVKIICQLCSIIILARLLKPEDFGLIAAVWPFLSLAGLIQDIGLNQAVIQREKITNKQINQVFWVIVLLSIVSTSLLINLSSSIADFYDDNRIKNIIILMAFTIFLGSLATVHRSLLSRSYEFKKLAIIDITSALVGIATSIILALMGASYWSLVYSAIAMSLTMLLTAWLMSNWQPNKPDFRIDKEIFSFGYNLAGFNILNFFSRNLDNILIVKALGSVSLGIYDRAYKILVFPLDNFCNPIGSVIIPVLSRNQKDSDKFRKIYYAAVSFISLLILPGVITIIICSDDVVSILLGSNWHNATEILRLLAIAGLVQPIANTTGWIFISQGKTKTFFKWGLISSFITVLSFIIGIQWGLAGICLAYTTSSTILIIPLLFNLINKSTYINKNSLYKILLPFLVSTLFIFFVNKKFELNLLIVLLFSYILSTTLFIIFKENREPLIEYIKPYLIRT